MTKNDTTPPAHGERTHAGCSPSSLKNRSICGNYLSDNDGPPHPITVEGEKIHEALDNDDDFDTLDDDTRPLAESCAEYRDHVLGPHSLWEMHKEIKLDTLIDDCYGFVDLLCISRENPTFGIIMDWKTGYNFQGEASVNLQGWAYVVGAFHKFPDLEEIEVHFPYPRLNEVTTHTFHRTDLPHMSERIKHIVDRWRSGDHYGPDITNCTYCSKKHECPALLNTTMEILEVNNDDYTAWDLSGFDLQKVEDPAVMARLMDIAPILEDLAGQIKRRGLNMRLEDGKEVPGYEVQERAGKLTATDPLPLIKKAKDAGLTDADIAGSISVKLPQLAKAVGKAAPRGAKKKVEDEFREKALEEGLARLGKPAVFLKASRKPRPELQQMIK